MKLNSFIASGVLLAVATMISQGASPREKLLMDFGWKFHRGDAAGAEQVAFDDAAWRGLDVPHDWSIEPDPSAKGPKSEGIFNPDCPSGSGGGFLPGGVGWYRKTFTLPESAKGRRVFVEFEGVYMDSDVWLNGRKLGNRPYGYSSFEYELTPFLKFGAPNVLAVRANVHQPCSRWFSGAGIYRHVWLTLTAPVHVAHWGVYVTTPEVKPELAGVRVRTRVLNQSDAAREVTLRTSLLDARGGKVAVAETKQNIAASGEAAFDQTLTVRAPKLWSLARPSLYTAVSEVVVDGGPADRCATPFGIRTSEFTKDRGFFLNGEHVTIQGVCDHHDLGCLGAAAADRAIERQLEILKAFGCNAIRTSHNPPAPRLLEAADRLGFLIMDEAFDEWKKPKTPMGYARFFDEWSERDLVAMLHRDRNHPCVVLWSIGNEIDDINTPEGAAIARRLAEICHREDPTRPVTSACNNPAGAVRSGGVAALDVFGVNYNIDDYDQFKGLKPMIASETSSSVSSRGEYNLKPATGNKVTIVPVAENHVTAYDTFRPPWAILADVQLLKMKDSPWVAGEFVWTGFDYIGEPTPYPWPAVSSYFGIVDLCGFPKDRFYLYQTQWLDKPMVHILPHWNWEGWEGKEIPVWCYAKADTVELFLNGKSLGERKCFDTFVDVPEIKKNEMKRKKEAVATPRPSLHVAWNVPYQPGALKAVARKNGRVVATDTVVTTGKPAKITLRVDRSRIHADGQDLAFVTAAVTDAQGRVCPNASQLIRFTLSGPGAIAAVGNGNPISHEDFKASQRQAFHGLCLVVVQAAKKSGAIRLMAVAEDLKTATVTIQAAACQPPPCLTEIETQKKK